MMIGASIRAVSAASIAALLIACSGGGASNTPSLSQPLPAAPNADTTQSPAMSAGTSYRITRLETLGGTSAGANGINNRSWVTGFSNLRGDTFEHAALWKGAEVRDLGTLGGPDSVVGWPVKDTIGEIVGESDLSARDPLAEDFCGNGTTKICVGFVWRNGVMRALPTLGGSNAQAAGENNRGEITGWAEAATRDASCGAPQKLDFFAFTYKAEGTIQKLRPIGTDRISAAIAINERGNVVGGSGFCGPVSPAISTHAVLWQNGTVVDLGSFGGKVNNYGSAINDDDDVVGQLDLPGDSVAHAFLWKAGRLTDLGTLPGDVSSFASDINNKGQIVGNSCDAAGNCRAVLWENGSIIDLNARVGSGCGLYLTGADGINDRGEIAGYAFDPRSGASPAFSATPTGASAKSNAVPMMILPERVRNQLRAQRSFLHAIQH